MGHSMPHTVHTTSLGMYSPTTTGQTIVLSLVTPLSEHLPDPEHASPDFTRSMR